MDEFSDDEEGLPRQVLAATYQLQPNDSSTSSVEDFLIPGVSVPSNHMMSSHGFGGGSLMFSDNRCGNCRSCNLKKSMGTCKKMAISLCSACRTNQKCWRFSPCEFVSDSAKEEFILGQLETRAKLAKRGPLVDGELLDRYGYQLKSVGRGLEKLVEVDPAAALQGEEPETGIDGAAPVDDRYGALREREFGSSPLPAGAFAESTRIQASPNLTQPHPVSATLDDSLNITIVPRSSRPSRELLSHTLPAFSSDHPPSVPAASSHAWPSFDPLLAQPTVQPRVPPPRPQPSLRPSLRPLLPTVSYFQPPTTASTSQPPLRERTPFSSSTAPPPGARPGLRFAAPPSLRRPFSPPPRSTSEPTRFPFAPVLPPRQVAPASRLEPPQPSPAVTRAPPPSHPSDLSQLAASIHQLAQQVAGAVSFQQPHQTAVSLPKAPSIQLIPLTLNESGHLDAVGYHVWKRRLRHQLEKLHISEDVALHLLLTRPNLLPPYLRDQMLNCETLDHLLARLDTQCPHLSAALPRLKEKITSLPPSGTSGLQIETRCTELLSALENLNSLFPSVTLGREELLACLSRLGGDEIISQIHASLNYWCELSEQGTKSLNESLYDFLLTVRSNRVELRIASELYHTKQPKERHLLPFSAEKPAASTSGSSTTPAPKPPPPGLKQDSPRDWSSIKCTLCKQFHKEARHACSKIKDILTGRFSVPSDICLKCLSLLNSDGRCSNTRQPCHVVRTAKGETVSLICSSHSPPTHFQICRSCAPDLPRSLSKQKTTLRFSASSPSSPQPRLQDVLPPPQDPFLRLQEGADGKVVLAATAGLCETIKCYHPRLKKSIDVFCQYDSGGGLSLAERCEELDLQRYHKTSELVNVQGLIGSEAGNLPVVLIRVMGKKQRDISFCVKSFPSDPPDPIMTQVVFQGEKAPSWTPGQLNYMPKLLIGQRLLKLHPIPLPEEEIPIGFSNTWPGLCVYRSQFSGRLLFGGHLAMAPPPSKLLLFNGKSSPACFPPVAPTDEEEPFREEMAPVGGKEKSEHPVPPLASGLPPSTVLSPLRDSPSLPESEATSIAENGNLLDLEDPRPDLQPPQVGEQEAPTTPSTTQPCPDEDCHPVLIPTPCTNSPFTTSSQPGHRLSNHHESTSVALDANFPAGSLPPLAPSHWSPPPWPPPSPSPWLNGEEPSQELLLAHLSWTSVVAEFQDALGPPLPSTLAGKIGINGCYSCSPLVKRFSHLAANDQLLQAQLEWNGKNFLFDRLHHDWLRSLPSGEKASIAVTKQLIRKLSSLPHSSQSVSYKLEEEFKLGKTRWVSPEELQAWTGPLHFLAPLLIVNLKSASSPLRLCQNPAARHRTFPPSPSSPSSAALSPQPPAYLSFNETIHQYGGDLITPEKFSLFQTTALALSAGDVGSAFRQIELHRNSQMLGLSHRLKSKKGFPTLVESECHTDRLFVCADNFASYGARDLPFVLATCLKMAPEVFASFAPPNLQASISPEIFRHASFILSSLAYLDDLPLASSRRHLEEHQKALPSSPWLEGMEKSVSHRNDHLTCVMLSEDEWDVHLREEEKAVKLHQREIIQAVLKILSFVGFHLKSIDSSFKPLSLLHSEHHHEVPLPTAHMEKSKPAASDIFKENGGGGNVHLQEQTQPFLTQMSKSMFSGDRFGDDWEGLKSKHLIFSKQKGYNFSGELHNYDQFLGFLSAHQNKLTRRFAVSCLSQFYDPRMRHLIIPTILGKYALYHLYTSSSAGLPLRVIGWEKEIGPEAKRFLLASVRAFFLLCHRQRKRCEIIFHSGAMRMLILLSDTSPALGGVQAFLVTGLFVGNVYQAKVHLLNQKAFLNRPQEKSVPHLELFHIFKNLDQHLKLIPWLESQGLAVPNSKIIVCTDSSSAALQLKSLFYSEFSLRTNFLCSKAAALMVSHGLDPLSHLFHLDQNHKGMGKFTFQCDRLTRPPTSLSDANILNWHKEVHYPDWLLWHPKKWTHLSRNAFIPRQISQSFLESINVNPAYLKKIAKRLETLRNLKSDRVLDKGSPMPKSSSQLISFKKASDDNIVAQIVSRRQRVLSRKGGAMAVLAKVIFAAARWRFLARLSPSQRILLKSRRIASYTSWRAAPYTSPWCGKLTCDRSSACVFPQSDFGGRRVPGCSPHLRFPNYLCCTLCISSGKALDWNKEASNEIPPCPQCLQNHFSFIEPVSCQGTSCVDGKECKVHGFVTFSEFTDTFLGAFPPLASGSQIHLRNKTLSKLLVHFPFSESQLDIFEELSLDYLAAVSAPKPDNCHLSGWSVYSGEVWGDLNMIYAASRQQKPRDCPSQSPAESPADTGGRVITRLLNPDHDMTQLVIRDVHETFSCADDSVLKYQLLKAGLFFPNAARLLSAFRRKCHRCRLRKGKENQTRNKLTQNLPGPSEELASLFSQLSPHSQWQVDHAGPCYLLQSDGNRTKVYILVAVQVLLRRVVLVPVESLKAVDLVRSLLLLALREGGAIKFVHSDPEAGAKPWATRSSDVSPSPASAAQEFNLDENPWIHLCSPNSTRSLKERNCIFRIAGVQRSHCQAETENIVRVTKQYFADNDSNFSNHSNLNYYEFEFFLTKIAYFLNSRPLWIWDNIAVSALDLLTAVGRCGPSSPALGLSLHPLEALNISDNKRKKQLSEVAADVATLSRLTQKLHQNLAYHFLPRLSNPLQPTSYRHRRGDKVEDLHIGAILIDSAYVSEFGACCGALCRLIGFSEGKRMAILVRVKQKLLHDHKFLMNPQMTHCLSQHLQPCSTCNFSPNFKPHLEIICRDSQNLFLVANGPPPCPPPLSNPDSHLTGPMLPPPLLPRFTLPDPGTLPQPLSGTVLPQLTHQELAKSLKSSAPESISNDGPRRSTRQRGVFKKYTS